ncbi:MAG: aminomethyl-transferring glycine dehydrogenase subunit GcvPA [Hyphomicrobiaceae bacterium]|nr:aminomethyl-transferring glycine dehydrogenase subunit GcvPA [Hyphomicrobiaceae bacterium]
MRYLPLEPADRQAMLASIGVPEIDALFDAVPPGKLMKELPNLPRAKGELEVERELMRLAARSVPAGSAPFFIGAGAYRHHVPAAVDHLIQRSEFLTSYTPYQPEISQGTLQVLFEFQTQVAMLTGMEVANASMYDGSTACGEAVLMAHRITRRRKALLAGGLHPHYRSVVETLAHWGGSSVVSLEPDPAGTEDIAARIDADTSCVVVQYPSFYGTIRDLKPIADAAHAKGALLVAVVTEAVALGMLKPPGEMGADIVAAEGQSIGNGLNFGGPYVGLFATREKFVRQMPGRLAGETLDAEGRRGYVLTLSTREQHIRREKATSNICTNSGLCALAFTIHMTLLGEAGLRRLARINHVNAMALADQLAKVRGVEVVTPAYFNEFTIRVAADAQNTIDALAKKGVMGGVPVSRLEPGRSGVRDLIVVAATEINTDEDRAAYVEALQEVL